ncbi:RAS small monomeric GTPase [Drechmeria coniospora]|uniref:RAS small monomeric GTPase n=1 Tax=Drechmeria coniospora TaxID=98403 RepID=A0A151GCH3_DRECN|nr:RAS small monomeric GTPase [Drechmeria coniospora]KYK54806.1 RAS small monomeric GTPase [Drechmeria coniospora]
MHRTTLNARHPCIQQSTRVLFHSKIESCPGLLLPAHGAGTITRSTRAPSCSWCRHDISILVTPASPVKRRVRRRVSTKTAARVTPIRSLLAAGDEHLSPEECEDECSGRASRARRRGAVDALARPALGRSSTELVRAPSSSATSSVDDIEHGSGSKHSSPSGPPPPPRVAQADGRDALLSDTLGSGLRAARRRRAAVTMQAQRERVPEPAMPISVTICGDGGCGKSSITLRLVRSQWTSEYDPTIEDSYSVTRRIDGTTYHLSLTDTAGQEEYRGMWASSNLGADAFLLVYDITSRDSLDALQYFDDLIDMEAETRLDNAERARRAGLNPVHANAGNASGSKTVPPVKIVAGNKCDLQESRQVPAAQGLDWARRRGCGFMETSARLEVNVEETFALIVRRVVERRRLAEMGVLDNTEMNARGMTKPLTPLPADEVLDEKRGGVLRGQTLLTDRRRRREAGFWRKLRCW